MVFFVISLFFFFVICFFFFFFFVIFFSLLFVLLLHTRIQKLAEQTQIPLSVPSAKAVKCRSPINSLINEERGREGEGEEEGLEGRKGSRGRGRTEERSEKSHTVHHPLALSLYAKLVSIRYWIRRKQRVGGEEEIGRGRWREVRIKSPRYTGRFLEILTALK